METVVLDKALVIIFGTVITILLGIIGYFVKQSGDRIDVKI